MTGSGDLRAPTPAICGCLPGLHNSTTLTREADLSFLVCAARDPSSRAYVIQRSLDEHWSALVDADIGHWIIQPTPHRCPPGYLITVGLKEGRGRVNLKRIVVTRKGLGVGR
jgi:diamine N-acetyltransferase